MSMVLDETAQRIGRKFVNKARGFLEEGDGDLERAEYYLDRAQGKGDEQLEKEIEDLKNLHMGRLRVIHERRCRGGASLSPPA